MRLVVDLQGCQTPGSRNRGIGNYSKAITEAIIRNCRDHEIFIVLNGRFHTEAMELKARFATMLPSERIFIFEFMGSCAETVAAPDRLRAAEALAEHFLRTLDPDIVLVTSLFEGLIDDAATSLDFREKAVLSATILYDLIPLIRKEHYLQSEKTRDWYYGRLRHAKHADILFAISESTRQEALTELNLAPETVVNISSAIGPQFVRLPEKDLDSSDVLQRLAIEPQFVLYTGGIDLRKNIEGLIEAYALVDRTLQSRHQLVVVCSVSAADARRLRELASGFGLSPDRLVMTGFISEPDLIQLYNLCHLFVFPSLHEGFGLPVLEAMSCGAPVIAGANSSLIELVEWPAALFDASSPTSMATLIETSLTDDAFRTKLRENGTRQVPKYSWDRSAIRLLEALETLAMPRNTNSLRNADLRLKLAIVTPAPPLQTGIADYIAEMMPFMSVYYDIDIVSDQELLDLPGVKYRQRSLGWFAANPGHYDRILYHFGNSDFHSHMPALLRQISGVVVLHDFFLSGLANWIECKRLRQPGYFLEALLDSHGLLPYARYVNLDRESLIGKLPINADVLDDSGGLIVHSEMAEDAILSQGWAVPNADVTRILHPRLLAHPRRAEARAALGIRDDTLLICSFGFLGRTKRSADLLEAFARARPEIRADVKLVYVGEGGPIGPSVSRRISDLGLSDHVQITGFANPEQYRRYLEAADFAVQLRRLTRGETSGATLDCMAFGVPLIVNAHGTMAEIDESLAYKLPDEFDPERLTEAIIALAGDAELRRSLADRARSHIATHHDPKSIAEQYYRAIETFYAKNARLRQACAVDALREVCQNPKTGEDLFAESVEYLKWNEKRRRQRRLYVDVSCLTESRHRKKVATGNVQRFMRLLVDADNLPYNVELVSFRTKPTRGFYTNRSLALAILKLSRMRSPKKRISPCNGDAFLWLDGETRGVADSKKSGRFSVWRAKGVDVFFLPHPLGSWLSIIERETPAGSTSASTVLKNLQAYEEITAPDRPFIGSSPTDMVPDRPFLNLSSDRIANRPLGEFLCTFSDFVMPVCRRTAVTKKIAEQLFSFGAEVQMRARARDEQDF